MATESISVPTEWTVENAQGRYEQTEFVFEFDREGPSRLRVRLLGRPDSEHRATYDLTVVLADDEETREFPVETFSSETTALPATERLLNHLQRAVTRGDLHLDRPDAIEVESVLDRFGAGPLKTRLKTLFRGISGASD